MPVCNLLRQAFLRNGAVRQTIRASTSSLATVTSRSPEASPPSRLLPTTASNRPILTTDAPPPPGPGYPPAGYGQQPAWAGYGAPAIAPTSQQAISWITYAVVGLLGLLGAILTLTLWINMSSAVSRASDVCNRFGGEYSTLCRQYDQT